MLDGAGALLAVPPRGDFAVQLFCRSHAKRGGVAVLSHGSEASHRRGRCWSWIVPEGGGSWTSVGQGAESQAGVDRDGTQSFPGVEILALPGEATVARTARKQLRPGQQFSYSGLQVPPAQRLQQLRSSAPFLLLSQQSGNLQ